MTQEEKAKRYDEAFEIIKAYYNRTQFSSISDSREEIKTIEKAFPELKESEDERIRKAIGELIHDTTGDSLWIDYGVHKKEALAWLEKQGSEPNWCHHNVDLSNCSEEYRKAYYDGWNNCNMQHSQCRSELDDVVKCLINGMKFYYEDNKEATWGTDKWSMPVKHIIEVLEKQSEQKPKRMVSAEAKEAMYGKPAWSEEDERHLNSIIKRTIAYGDSSIHGLINDDIDWLKSLKDRYTWKPSDEQMITLRHVISGCSYDIDPLVELETKLKEL